MHQLNNNHTNSFYSTMLFYGVPGNGKTVIADYLGNMFKEYLAKFPKLTQEITIIFLPGGEKRGSLEKGVDEILNIIKQEILDQLQKGHVIIIFDEVQNFLKSRKDKFGNLDATMTNAFLSIFDEAIKSAKLFNEHQKKHEKHFMFFVSTTNYVEEIDPAAIRSKRLGDIALEIKNPDAEYLALLLENKYKKEYTLSKEFSTNTLINMLHGKNFSIADLDTIFESAFEYALYENEINIKEKHLLEAIEEKTNTKLKNSHH